MKHLLYIGFFVLLAGCGYNDFDPVGPEEITRPNATLRISTLRSFYRGQPVDIDGESILVSGWITTSDKTNNFYRTFIVEDETGAVEIRAGLYDLHNLYRLGQQVVVHANGLTLGMSNGLLQLGLKSHTPALYDTEYIDYRPLLEQHVLRKENYNDLVPIDVDFEDLKDDMIGQLVRIKEVRTVYAQDTIWAVPAALSPTGSPLTANLLFRRTPDDSIYVSTSGYANFAEETVPRGTVDITGILLKNKVSGKECYQLKLRDTDDVRQ